MAAYLMSERTAAFVRAQMARQGAVPDGTAGATRRSRPSFVRGSDYAAPFAVRWAASVGEEGAWIIWLPGAGALVVDGEAVEITGEDGAALKAAGGGYPDGWKVLADIDASGGKIHLNIYCPDADAEESDGPSGVAASDGSDTSGEDESVRAELAATPGEDADGVRCVTVLVATVSRATDTGVVTVEQNVVGALVLTSTGSAVEVDGVSIDAAGTKDGAAATGGETGTLQLAHFNDSERDSGRGLAPRLRADPETGEISAQDGDAIMLVARLDGKICYIPLGGDGEDPGGGKDPCDHDDVGGEGGGVSVDKAEGVEGGSDRGGAGDGGVHPGDDDCNCE